MWSNLPSKIGLSAENYFFVETPSDNYWKQLAEERRKALYDVLQENEKVSSLLKGGSWPESSRLMHI